VLAKTPFAALFRRWTVEVARGKIPGGLDLHHSLGSRLLCGARRLEVPLVGGLSNTAVTGSAAAYFLLHTPGRGSSRITVEGEPESDLQVTLLTLPTNMPRLSLQAEIVSPGACRLLVTAHDADVTLDEAAWEKSAPEGVPGETSYRPGEVAGASVQAWFGEPLLKADSPRRSRVIERPPAAGQSWLFKLTGHDATGRPVAAFAELAL
jgi:hypothetical protein